MNTQEKQIRELAANAFADHVVTERLRQGAFRSWRCQKPETWVYGFDITTTPGYLIVTGDIGDLIVSRVVDMLPWCRSSIDSTRYFAEKVVHAIPTREFSFDEVIRWAHEELADPDCPEGTKASYQHVLDYGDELSESELHRETQHLWQGCDPPDWRVWNSNFLWCREAIRWFLQHHEEPEVKPQ